MIPGLSVIVAGATGSTGGELVSKLVSHKDVSRVVALSRTEISVDKWSNYFPNLKHTDALKYLSVVSVDWDRIHRDSGGIPSSLLCGNPHMVDTADERNAHEIELSTMLEEVSDGNPELFVSSLGRASQSPRSPRRSTDPLSSLRTPELRAMITASQKASLTSLLHDPYYRSIFSGHHVAINCLGSHHIWLSSSRVNVVDHQYSIAFAKFIRLFSCSDVTNSLLEDISSLSSIVTRSQDFRTKLRACDRKEAVVHTLIDLAPRKDHDSPYPPFESYGMGGYIPRLLRGTLEWNEVRSACFGIPRDDDFAVECDSAMDKLRRGKRHVEHTLQHFIQVSTAGASTRNPIPYFKVHGLCDDRLVHLFDHQLGTSEGRHIPDVTIFRPGLIQRRKARWSERVLSFVMAPIPVDTFAEVILDDLFSKRDSHNDAKRERKGDRCPECTARASVSIPPKLSIVNSFEVFSQSRSRHEHDLQ